MVPSFAQRHLRALLSVIAVVLVALVAGPAFFHANLANATAGTSTATESGNIIGAPTIADWLYLSGSTTPPDESACNAVGRRCFTPAAMAGAYDYQVLHATGIEGQGTTIAIVDSYGSETIASDLNVFDTAFGLPHMCGETGVTCQPGMPTFSLLNLHGPAPTPPPPNNGTGLEDRAGWSIETSLDVEWAHATAPLANILLVTTPTAETLGVQGLAQMMNDEQYVVDHHLADVISQSFGAGEATFGGEASLMNLRHAFVSAVANHVTVVASSGDGGTTNSLKTPVKNPNVIPYPSVIWPASDPLVTGVGGTYLCMDTTAGTTVDSVSPPSRCRANPGQREVGWVAGGGGYSIFFSRPAFQDTLPIGSTYAGSSAGAPGPNTNMRGVPDVSYQASATTGPLVYDTEAGIKGGTAGCGGADPCSTGWYVIGGTSCSAPQWAGLIAMADQMAHLAGKGDVGYINPALYQIASNPSLYAADFHDITVGKNQLTSIPGYSASQGWDAVTGLGTPDAAYLLPDLVAAAAS